MRKAILTTFTVLALAGGTVGAVAFAQPAPPQPPAATDSGPQRPHRMGWQRGHDGQQGHAMQRLRNFALVYPQADRKLTPPDVQKIAEAFLLWHGNHTWKVIDVAPTADGPIAFAIATPEGSVVARFTMDPRTARVTRTG